MAELRELKRRAGIAEEAVRIKKERLDEAEQEYEEEHRTFTVFSNRLEEKWEQRFEALARLALDAGVRQEDIEAVRKQPLRAVLLLAVQDRAAAEQEAAAMSERAAEGAASEGAAAEGAVTEGVAAEGAAAEEGLVPAADEPAAGEAVVMQPDAASCGTGGGRKRGCALQA